MTEDEIPETVPLDLLRRYMRMIYEAEGITGAEHVDGLLADGFSAAEAELLHRLNREVAGETEAAAIAEPTTRTNPMTEDEILSAKPYADQGPAPTLESLAGELIDTVMHRLSTFREFGQVIREMTQEQKQPIDNDLMSAVVIALRMSPLVMKPAASATPSTSVVSVSVTPGEPLEPEMTGETFVVQPGGLLLSQQKPAEKK
jgi:hypothetical protein